MGDHYFPQIPVKMESNRNNPIFRLKKSKVVEPSLRYVALTKFGLLGSFLCPLTKSECFYSIESSEGNETLGSHSEWRLICFSSMQRPESRNSGGCFAGDGREIKIMNQNTTQGRSGKTDERQIYLPGFYESTRPYPQFQAGITVPNAPPFGDKPQLRNTSLNFASTPPSVEKLLPSATPACRKRSHSSLCTSVEPQSGNVSYLPLMPCVLRHGETNGMSEKSIPEFSPTHLQHESGNVETSHTLSSTSVEPQFGNELLNSHSSPPPPVLLPDKSLNNRRRMLEDCWVGPGEFQCLFCPQLKNTKRLMKNHILKSHRSEAKEMGLRGPEHLYCKICGGFNSDKINLEKHMRWYHNTETNGPLQKRPKDNLDMFEDWRVDPKTFQCRICLRKINSRKILKTHILKWHYADGKKLGLSHAEDLVCKICGRFIHSRTELKKHMEMYHEAVSSLRPESRSSGGCSAGDGREIEIMNQNTTRGISGKTDESYVYLEGGPPSTGCYESGNVPTTHNFPSTSVESQSGNRPEFSFDPFVISDPCCGEHWDFIDV